MAAQRIHGPRVAVVEVAGNLPFRNESSRTLLFISPAFGVAVDRGVISSGSKTLLSGRPDKAPITASASVRQTLVPRRNCGQLKRKILRVGSTPTERCSMAFGTQPRHGTPQSTLSSENPVFENWDSRPGCSSSPFLADVSPSHQNAGERLHWAARTHRTSHTARCPCLESSGRPGPSHARRIPTMFWVTGLALVTFCGNLSTLARISEFYDAQFSKKSGCLNKKADVNLSKVHE